MTEARFKVSKKLNHSFAKLSILSVFLFKYFQTQVLVPHDVQQQPDLRH